VNSVSDVLTAVKIVMDLSKEVDEWLSRFKSVKYLIEIELRSVPGDAEDVRTFVGRMLEEMGCGEEGDCVFMGARLRAAAFVYSTRLAEEAAHLLGEEELPDAADVLLVVGVQRAKPGTVYELVEISKLPGKEGDSGGLVFSIMCINGACGIYAVGIVVGGFPKDSPTHMAIQSAGYALRYYGMRAYVG
jgi:hypothetical protein